MAVSGRLAIPLHRQSQAHAKPTHGPCVMSCEALAVSGLAESLLSHHYRLLFLFIVLAVSSHKVADCPQSKPQSLCSFLVVCLLLSLLIHATTSRT